MPAIQAGELFLLRRGHVSVLLKRSSSEDSRLATFSAGMVFGEMASSTARPGRP